MKCWVKMRKINLLLCVLIVCVLCSCSVVDKAIDVVTPTRNTNYNSSDVIGDDTPEDDLGKEKISQIINGIENKDIESITKLFCKTVKKNKNSLNQDIGKLIKFYNSTKHKKIKYEYSVAHNDTNDGSNYDYDECLAFVQTENKVFSFDFVVCSYDERTEDNVGIWFIIVSDKQKRENSKEFDNLYNKLYNNLSEPSNNCSGIYIL